MKKKILIKQLKNFTVNLGPQHAAAHGVLCFSSITPICQLKLLSTNIQQSGIFLGNANSYQYSEILHTLDRAIVHKNLSTARLIA